MELTNEEMFIEVEKILLQIKPLLWLHSHGCLEYDTEIASMYSKISQIYECLGDLTTALQMKRIAIKYLW